MDQDEERQRLWARLKETEIAVHEAWCRLDAWNQEHAGRGGEYPLPSPSGLADAFWEADKEFKAAWDAVWRFEGWALPPK